MSHNPAYATVSDIKSAVGIRELTETIPIVNPVSGLPSPAYPGLTTDEAKIESKIEQKSNYIDSMIGDRVTVPITGTVPGKINEITIRLVVPEIYQDEPGIPVDSETKRNEAESDLKKIAMGELHVSGLNYKRNKVTVVQAMEAEGRGQYDESYNNNAGVAVHMGLYRGR
jgi:hypothetical protein